MTEPADAYKDAYASVMNQLHQLCDDFGCPVGAHRFGWLRDRLSEGERAIAAAPAAGVSVTAEEIERVLYQTRYASDKARARAILSLLASRGAAGVSPVVEEIERVRAIILEHEANALIRDEAGMWARNAARAILTRPPAPERASAETTDV